MTNTITSLPRTATFQFRINPKVRERVEAAKREQAVNRLMSEIAIGEASAEDVQGTCGRDGACECNSCWVRRGGYNVPR